MSTADPETFHGTERFHIQRRLGAGSFGVVYEVIDSERNARVALKALRQDADRSLYRFKQEFRSLAGVSHPNVVTLYELLSDRDHWFFTMEHVEGVSFLEYVGLAPEGGPDRSDFSRPTRPDGERLLREGASEMKGAPPLPELAGCPADLDRLREALIQLTDGVLALHATGKLHRDIKPSNVLVTREGRVVILDFGLVRDLSSELSHTLDSAGTPAYMSPEQAAELPLTEASDWYSVGVMLYEALTGRLPFSGPTMEVLRRKRDEDPPPPRAFLPGIPSDLDALCRGLMRRDPRKRLSGADVRRRLGRPSPVVAPPAGPALQTPQPFVGRERQLAALHEAYRLSRSGRAVTVTISGGSGMGKTALLKHFVDEVRAADPEVLVLSGRCYERESVPYQALDSVLDALSRHLRRTPAAEVDALLPHDVLALARLFPVLRQVGAVARARRTVLDIPDSLELRRRAFGALRELLVRLVDQRPVLVAIDDLQWGDADSAALLTDLFRPPDPPTLLLLGCYRTEEAATSPLLSALLPVRASSGAAVLGKVDIEVGELPPPDALQLACALLGPAASDRGQAEAIARESQGNPFLLDALSKVQEVEPGSEGPRVHPRPETDRTTGRLLDDMIRLRVERLPSAAQRLLAVVAVAAQPVELVPAFHAAGFENEGDAALAALRSAQLVRTRRTAAREEIEIYHDRIRGAVIAPLTVEALRLYHQRLAAALLASARADTERLAVHFQEAGEPETAAEYAAAAANDAAQALAFDRAARLYQLALSLRPPGHPGEHLLRLRLADALANAGRAQEAAEAYLAAVDGTAPAERIDLHRRAAEQLLIGGHIDDGLRALDIVLASLGMSLPRSARTAKASLLMRRTLIRLRGLRFRRRDASRVASWDLLRVDTCWSVAVGLEGIDMVLGADFQARHLLLALRAGEPHRVARALALEIPYTATGGTRTRARTDRLIATAHDLAAELKDDHAIGLATFGAGVAAWTVGKWKDALRLCDQAESVLRERCTGARWEIGNAQTFAVASLFMLGEITELSLRVRDLLKRAQERGDLMAATNYRVGFFAHMVWLAADDPQRARREVQAGLEGWSRQMFDGREIWARGALRDIALYTGEGLDASEPVREGWRLSARSLDGFAQAGLILGLYSRGRWRVTLAANAADPASAEAELVRAEEHARAIERERTPWGEPLALILRAGAAVTRGDVERATTLARAAESGLDSADMTLHAAAVRRRRGQLAAGSGNSDLLHEADRWMAAHSIKNPERIAAMLVPGRWERGPL